MRRLIDLNQVVRPLTLAMLLSTLLVVLIMVRAPAVVTWLDVGSPGDAAYVDGFFGPEQSARESFRWSTGDAALSIPVPDPGRYRVDLQLASVGAEPRELTVACGKNGARVELDQSGGLGADVVCTTGTERVDLQLAVPALWMPGDGRDLGVAVRDVQAVALDADDRLVFGLKAFAAVAGSLVGLALALSQNRRLAYLALSVLVSIWLLVLFAESAIIHALIDRPTGLVVLLSGLAAWSIGRRLRWLAIGAVASSWLLLMIWTPDPVLLIPGRWNSADLHALRSTIWLTPLAGTAGLLLNNRRLAIGGALIAAVAQIAPLPGSLVTRFWSLQVIIPDWTAHGSAIGALYLVLVVGLVGFALWSVRERSGLTMTLVAALLGITGLLIWRAGTMRFNGDEPHYYVMARSIGQDGDLELLDDYLDDGYREVTVSPDGNIAAQRDFSANRYSGLVPGGDGRWWLEPAIVAGEAPTLQPAGEVAAAPRLNGPDGSFVLLPALAAAGRLSLLLDGPCHPETLWIGATGDDTGQVTIRSIDAAGGERWSMDYRMTGPAGAIDLSSRETCDDERPAALEIESAAGPVVALAIDRDDHLQVIPGIPSGDRWFAGWPADRYASPDVQVTVLLHNPGSDPATVTVRPVLGGDAGASEVAVEVPSGATVERAFRLAGAAGLRVDVGGSIVVDAVARVSGAYFRLPSPPPVASWTVSVPANDDRDAGLWLAVVNPQPEPIDVVIDVSGESAGIQLCPGCGDMRHIPANEDEQIVNVEVVGGGEALIGGVRYVEETGALHFDLGLPLLGAIPARIGPPWLVLVVPALAGVSIAPALYLLLRAIGEPERWAMLGGACGALLAPLSTYAVRFYTDVVAAAIVTWVVVCWERGRRDQRWLAGLPVAAVALVLLHGRFIPLALAALILMAQALVARADLERVWSGWALALASIGLVVIALGTLAASQFIVALDSRNIDDYVQLRWVPRNVVGMLFDRNSGLLPFAPWVVLALFVPRPLKATQRIALALTLLVAGMVAVRAGSWLTWGAPGRYLLTGVAPLMLLAAPAMRALWRVTAGRVLVVALLGWSVGVTLLLHWVPLAGYIAWPRYLIDEALRDLLGWSPYAIFPRVTPDHGGLAAEVVGGLVLAGLGAAIIWLVTGGGQAARRAREAAVNISTRRST